MKYLFALLLIASISSCSFIKDMQKHCEVKYTSIDIQSGSFDGCLKCDSLAKVVKAQIEKGHKK